MLAAMAKFDEVIAELKMQAADDDWTDWTMFDDIKVQRAECDRAIEIAINMQRHHAEGILREKREKWNGAPYGDSSMNWSNGRCKPGRACRPR